jgi:acetyl esterase
MAIDPQLLSYYRQMADLYANEPIPEEAAARRSRFEDVAARSRLPDTGEISVTDLAIPGDGAALKVRLFRPANVEQPRLIVYFHGGGWVVGSPETHHTVAALLAADTQCVVASVDYRLAPEYAFPTPCDDAVAAVQWLAASRESLGVHPDFLAVAGDSAGAHLAAAAARRQRAAPCAYRPGAVADLPRGRAIAHDRELSRIRGRAWSHPRRDGVVLDAVHRRRRTGQGCRAGRSPDPSDGIAAHHVAPASVVLVAANDVLRDDGLAYANFLVRHDAPVITIEASGMTHGFARLQPDAPRAREWMRRAAEAFTGVFDDL